MKIKSSPLIPIFLIVFVDILGLTIILPLFPFYAQKFGATPAVVGSLVSIYALCQFVAGPILGQLSDRHGRRPILIISQIGTFVGLLVVGFASSLWMLFLGRILDGITAGNITVAQAAISDVTPPQDRVRAYGIIGVSFGLGFLLGPAISGLLVGYGMNTPIFAAAGLSALSILGTIFLLPKTVPVQDALSEKGLFIRRETWKRLLTHPELKVYLGQFFLFSMIFTCFTSGFALFAERRYFWNGQPFGAREVGFVLAGLGLYGIVLQGGLLGRLVKRWGEVRLVQWGFLACMIGYGLLGWAMDFGLLAVALVVASFGTGVLRPALTALISQNAEPNEQGLVIGVSQSLGSIAAIIAPLLAGALIQSEHLILWTLLMTLISGVALAMIGMSNRSLKAQKGTLAP
jgi:DHA1 family tetracycline resistance protein-like MFS transporter